MQNSIFMADFNRWRWGISPQNFRRVLGKLPYERQPASMAGPFMRGEFEAVRSIPLTVPRVFIWEIASDSALVRGPEAHHFSWEISPIIRPGYFVPENFPCLPLS